LPRDLRQATESIDHFLAFNLPSGVVRNLLAARREIQKAEASVAAAITVADLEVQA